MNSVHVHSVIEPFPAQAASWQPLVEALFMALDIPLCYSSGPKLQIELANKAFCALVGRADVVGSTVSEVLPQAAGPIRETSPQDSEMTDLPAALTGVNQPAGMHCVRISLSENDEGFLIYQTAAGSDATGKLEALGRLTGSIAHDFNNILQVIAGNLQLLYPSAKGSSAIEKRLEAAIGAVERGASLSSRLLAFGQRQSLQPAPLDIARLVYGMVDPLRRRLGSAIDVQVVAADGLWPVLADPVQLESALLELAMNAGDAMRGAGTLSIALNNVPTTPGQADSDEWVSIKVSDTGHGMTAEIAQRAFEPFFTTKTLGDGIGLGLSTVHGFVRQSKGRIGIQSTPDRGTSVTMLFPRSQQYPVAAAEQASGPLVGGSETILVVEDDPGVQSTVVDMLSSLGYRVLRADNAENALVVLKSGVQVDLLFSDVMMPGPVRSSDLAQQAQTLVPAIEILFTSGYAYEAASGSGRLGPGVSLLAKPYRREELARKVHEKLYRRKQTVYARTAAMAGQWVETGHDPASRRRRILVVEDNDDSRELVCEMLMVLGYDATGMATGEDAIRVLSEQAFDLLFSDINLPGISGLELAERAAATQPGLKVILSSGYGKAIPVNLPFKPALLPKPYDMTQLQDALESFA